MKNKSQLLKLAVLIASTSWIGGGSPPAWAGACAPSDTCATNIGGIINTRHNLTQSFLPANSWKIWMDLARNDYGEICVYCHTPHAANTQVSLPLWNRTIPSTTYNTYNSSTLTQSVSQPGPNSLSCLSCHDGTVAVDSIINMPGPGGYQATQETSQSNTFLDAWSGPGPGQWGMWGGHGTLVGNNFNYGDCGNCHMSGGDQFVPGNGTGSMPDFTVFAIGADLRNDHPVGVRYPTPGLGVEFNPTSNTHNNIAYFDGNGNNKLDPSDIRLYNTGAGYEVECASCHDPHGVPSNGVGTVNNNSFMRVSNTGSALCLTCHVK